MRVNAVCPGVFRTPWVEKVIAELPAREELHLSAQPIGRLGRPRRIGRSSGLAVSRRGSFCSGHAFPVDGGLCRRIGPLTNLPACKGAISIWTFFRRCLNHRRPAHPTQLALPFLSPDRVQLELPP
ncbi:MAG: SDR family oxidoreductase [Candidatus Latescibacteria bacterium]|nr:SDR family oxidoreductase [Candidatus Latescibacterota bacterium]